jgi:SAM-dependent methyltransferase
LTFQRAFEGDSGTVVSTDICRDVLAAGKRLDKKAACFVSSADTALCFRERVFNCTVFCKILPCFTERVGAALQRHYNLLKDDGHLIIVEPSNYLDKDLYDSWLEGLKAMGYEMVEEYSGYVKLGGTVYPDWGLWVITAKKRQKKRAADLLSPEERFRFFFELPHTIEGGKRFVWREERYVARLQPRLPLHERDINRVVFFNPRNGEETNTFLVP